jgi:hypothetical protein
VTNFERKLRQSPHYIGRVEHVDNYEDNPPPPFRHPAWYAESEPPVVDEQPLVTGSLAVLLALALGFALGVVVTILMITGLAVGAVP